MQQRLVIGNKARGIVPPATSFWVGVTREELHAAIQARRGQQRPATAHDITHDPTLAATVALLRDHPWQKAASR